MCLSCAIKEGEGERIRTAVRHTSASVAVRMFIRLLRRKNFSSFRKVRTTSEWGCFFFYIKSP